MMDEQLPQHQNRDVIIDNLDEASKYFMNFITGFGKFVDWYINSEEVVEVFARRVVKNALEIEVPDLSKKELIKLQEERLNELSKQK